MSIAHRMTVLILLLAVSVSGCSGLSADVGSDGRVGDSQQTPAESPAADPGSSAAGSQLAPGLHELGDGKVQAVGKLEWRDLEGGFWVVTGGTEADGNVGATVAVIANGEKFRSELEALAGEQVLVWGTKLDGASIRMAGPEIEMERIEARGDAAGAAQ